MARLIGNNKIYHATRLYTHILITKHIQYVLVIPPHHHETHSHLNFCRIGIFIWHSYLNKIWANSAYHSLSVKWNEHFHKKEKLHKNYLSFSSYFYCLTHIHFYHFRHSVFYHSQFFFLTNIIKWNQCIKFIRYFWFERTQINALKTHIKMIVIVYKLSLESQIELTTFSLHQQNS